jgi:nucleotide-binding universal stress UspA family protein
MSYATVVLPLDAHPGIDARIDQAARLARRFDGHLVGLAAADHSLLGLAAGGGFSGAPPLAHTVQECRAAARAHALRFEERLRSAAAAPSFEAVVDDEDEVGALVRRSTCCDLLVLGQPDPSWQGFARCREQLERVVLQSAAPTLVLPFVAARPQGDADTVLVAWDGSHGAARAVAGALPALQRASRVHLVRCETPRDVEVPPDGGGFDLARDWLGRHGVRIDTHLERAGGDVAAVLLARSRELGADLVVMGAWGLPRWAERLVGGTTRAMLARMDVPVLMSR